MVSSPSKPLSPTEPKPPLTDNERVDQAGWGSFPASDPPPWTFGRESRPPPEANEPDDPDGVGERDHARRRRHTD